MYSLQSKIQEASNLFQTHDFKKSLQLYDHCIGIARKNSESKTLIQNLISSKAAIMSILGDQKEALQCVNEVLDYEPYHSLCLFRRSQIYKKMNKLNKALKDLKLLMRFSPDNLQIAALKVQIQNLKLKTKQTNSSQSESQKSVESIDLDQQQQLNFSNLKKIDRKSVSIIYCGNISRKSRVTIAGDFAVTYQAQQDQDNDDKNSFASTNVSKQYLKQKFVKTFKQIQLDDQQQDLSQKQSLKAQIIKIKTLPPGRQHKSILKNRDSTIYVNTTAPVQKQKKYGGRQSKMIDLLKNIDGKVIEGVQKERQRISVSSNERPSKQVQFRKSIFGGVIESNNVMISGTASQNGKSKVKTGPRKSCLKLNTSNNSIQQPTKAPQPRRSKFQRISQVGIDGVVLKKQLSRDTTNQNQIKNSKNQSDSDSDNSEHNIFGGKQLVISKQVRENLGIGDGSLQDTDKKSAHKPRTTGGKSILKKNSILVKSANKNSIDKSPSVKAKKSVMFTRFNNDEE